MKLSIPAINAFAVLALAAGCGSQAEAEPQPAAAVVIPEGGDATPKVEAKTAEVAPAAEPAAAKAPMAFGEKPAVGTKATCPVMKGEFVVSETTEHSEHDGKHYAFCCPGCKPQFDAAPGKFIDR